MKTANEYYDEMMALEKGVKINKPHREPMTWAKFEDAHPVVATILMYIGMFFVSAFFVAMLVFGCYLQALGI
jgi:hypothetical protein